MFTNLGWSSSRWLSVLDEDSRGEPPAPTNQAQYGSRRTSTAALSKKTMTPRQAPSRPIRITVSFPILTVAFDSAPHHPFPLALFLPPLFSLSPKPITTPPSTLSS